MYSGRDIVICSVCLCYHYSNLSVFVEIYFSLCPNQFSIGQLNFLFSAYECMSSCLQCFNAVGWAAGRASGL